MQTDILGGSTAATPLLQRWSRSLCCLAYVTSSRTPAHERTIIPIVNSIYHALVVSRRPRDAKSSVSSPIVGTENRYVRIFIMFSIWLQDLSRITNGFLYRTIYVIRRIQFMVGEWASIDWERSCLMVVPKIESLLSSFPIHWAFDLIRYTWQVQCYII